MVKNLNHTIISPYHILVAICIWSSFITEARHKAVLKLEKHGIHPAISKVIFVSLDQHLLQNDHIPPRKLLPGIFSRFYDIHGPFVALNETRRGAAKIYVLDYNTCKTSSRSYKK